MENVVEENSYQNNQLSTYKGEKMIAIMSGKHNCGKTWLAISLAQILSSFKQKVLLVDTSGGANNVKSQLGLSDQPDLDEVIYGEKSLNQLIIPYNKGRFDMILGNGNSAGLSTMSVGGLQIFSDDLDIVAKNYDKAIIDIDSTYANAAEVLSGMAKSVIIVSNVTISSLTDSYQLICDLKRRCPQTKIGVVINQANNHTEGLRAYDNLRAATERFLEYTPELLGIVREDTRVRDAIRNQSTIINRYPQSEAAIDTVAIAKRILQNDDISTNN